MLQIITKWLENVHARGLGFSFNTFKLHAIPHVLAHGCGGRNTKLPAYHMVINVVLELIKPSTNFA